MIEIEMEMETLNWGEPELCNIALANLNSPDDCFVQCARRRPLGRQ